MRYNLKRILKKLNVRDFKDRYLKVENDVTSLFNKDNTALIEIRTNTRTLNKKNECYYPFKEAKLLSQVEGEEFVINDNKELTTLNTPLKLENSDMKIDKAVLKHGDFYIKFLNEDIKQFYDLIEDYRLVKISFNNYTLKIEGYKKEEEPKLLLEKHKSCEVDREYYAIISTSILKQFKKILVDESCLKFYLYHQRDECFKIESCNSELNIFIAPVRKAGE